MTRKSVIVIGGGIAGLSAACYGRMSGFDTRVFERSARPGGVCTGWRRGEYTIDGCIRWLMGTVPQDRCYQVWNELGVIDACQMIRRSELIRVQAEDGRTLVVHRDIDELSEHLTGLSPSDSELIDELAEGVRTIAGLRIPRMPPRELIGSGRWQRTAAEVTPLMRLLTRGHGDRTLEGFASRFSDPFLRRALPAIFAVPGFSVVTAMIVLAGLTRGDGSIPRGGSLALTSAISERYQRLGGTLLTGQSVREIVVEQGRACGIRLEDGSEHRADVVISAADGHTTLFGMLGGRHLTQELRRWYRSEPIFPPLVQISLCVNRDESSRPQALRYLLDRPIDIAGLPGDWIGVRHSGHDPSMAPPGCSVVVIDLASSYERWKALSAEPLAYTAEKRRITDELITWLDRRWPGLASQVEHAEVATPLTYERHTGNWRGSPEGWVPTPQAMGQVIRGTLFRRRLPGLAGFYLAGQWVEPGGGLPAAALSGREVIQLVCHDEGLRFVSGEDSQKV